MAKRKIRTHASDRPISQWVFLLVGAGFGAALIASGVLVRVHGRGFARKGAAAETSDVSTVGVCLIAMGVVAMGLTIGLLLARRSGGGKKRRKKGK